MKFFAFIIIVPLVLIAALVAAAYITDRFHIGTNLNRQQTVFNPTPQDWAVYEQYLEAVAQCVGNNYSSCGLCRPGNLPQHMAPNSQGIICENGKIFFMYLFDRRYSMNGGLGNYSYDTTPIQQISRKLNSTLPNYCVAFGLPPVRIVDARDVGNGRIALYLGEKQYEV